MSGSKTASTALHDAAGEGDVRRVGVLVEERKEDVWTKDEDGWLRIHHAALSRGPDVVRSFVVHANSHPEDGDLVNAQTNRGATPLHLAAGQGDAASLVVLVGEGRADPWIKMEGGVLPIHYAAWYGHPEAVQFFLRYSASHPERGDMLNDRDNGGNTPLSCAVQEGHVECVRLLLEAGADVTIANKAGKTPIDLAENGSEISSCLIREAEVKYGKLPLKLAAITRDLDSLKQLLEEDKTRLWNKAEDGRLPIHTAAQFGGPEVVAILLRYREPHPEDGDMVNCRNDDGETPLSLAVQKQDIETVRLLLQAGADLNIANKAGKTPIDLAENGSEILSELRSRLPVKGTYEEDDLIGAGAYGYVTCVVHKITGQKYAKKTAKPVPIDEKTYREIHAMEKLSHENIVQLVEHFLHERKGKTSITLIMELCDENLHEWLERHPFERRCHGDVMHMLVGLSNGLAYIHEQRIIHRDLHPGNILIKLVNGEQIVKITDFGLSVAVNTGNTSHSDRVGHNFYRAPEASYPDERMRLHYDFKIDVYSAGFIFYELLGNFPFSERKERLEDALRPKFVPNIRDSPEERNIIIRMLSYEPEKRPTSREVADKAAEWERKAGADVTIASKAGKTPVDLAEKGSDISSLLTRKQAMDDKYEFLHHKVLGEGSFGLVTVAVHKGTGERFAKKTTKLIREPEKIKREIEMMKKLRHPNIVELFEHSSVEEEGGTSITLIMELCDQSLHNWLKTHPFEKRCRQDVTSMLVGLSEGLAFIHEQKIIHRNLHTANVLMKLVNGKAIIKITDFGLSILEFNTGYGYTLRSQFWQPPEMWRRPTSSLDVYFGRKYNTKVDVYAEGLIFYELLANFEFTERMKHLEWAIGSFFVKNFGRDFPDEMKLIIQMLSEDPENRPSSREVVEKAKEWEERASMERKQLEKDLNEMHA
ncbi:unnamed protein product [Cyprideis torosa]|uniref:Uncharacterized protein n=1 Tax=Cyprideis torosa TaxID=163714 RepID=A0A7R8ZPA2_9CRUS|nr:unnamed protein product [Cyprideis torosa]CAG0898326.1 unnamed protein product [Cyprideis torosa]